MGPENDIYELEAFVKTDDGWKAVKKCELGKLMPAWASKLRDDEDDESEDIFPLTIDKVIFSGPATIVFWADGTKTVVKCMDSDHFSYDMGIYAATVKKIFGASYSVFKKDVQKYVAEEMEAEEKYGKSWSKTISSL